MRFCKNVFVLKEVRKTVAVFAFFNQSAKRALLPAMRIPEQPLLLTKSKSNRPGYKHIFLLKTGSQISYLFQNLKSLKWRIKLAWNYLNPIFSMTDNVVSNWENIQTNFHSFHSRIVCHCILSNFSKIQTSKQNACTCKGSAKMRILSTPLMLLVLWTCTICTFFLHSLLAV